MSGAWLYLLCLLGVAEVVPEAENIVAREQAMARDVMAGTSVVEVMGINYEQMLAR